MTRTPFFLSIGLLAAVAVADTFTWDGGGADNYWLTDANWSTDLAPTNNGTALLAFSGNVRAVTTNNCTADTVFAGISLANNKTNNLSSFTLAGNRLVLGGNLTTTASSPGTLSDTLALSLLLNAARTVTVNSAHNLTISGVIGETDGSQSFTKQGGGDLTLTGANTYSGKTSLSGGRVYYNSLGNLGVACSFGAPATAENGVIDVNARMTYTGGAMTSDRVLNFLGDSQFEHLGSGTLTLTGGITGAGRTPFIRGGGTIIVSGLINLGSGGITRTDGGTLILSNPANAFTGGLSSLDGTISADALADSGIACPIGAGSKITIGQANGTTGRVRYTGASDASCNRAITVVAQPKNTNGGIIENATAGTTLTLSGNVSVDLWTNTPTLQLTGFGNGVLSGVINGAMRVTENGTGSWTLSGANTYTGVTTVSSGTLLINGSTAAGSALSVAAAGTLGGTGTVNGVVSLAAGARLAPGNNGVGTLTLANASAAALTLNGNTVTCEVSAVAGVCDTLAIAGTLVLNGANKFALAFPGGTAPAGTYTLVTYAATNGLGTLTLDRPYPNATFTVGGVAATMTVSGSGTTATPLVWQGGLSANAWDTTTANWVPVTYGDNSIVVFDDTGSASPAVNITPDAVAPYSLTVNTSTKAYTIGGAGITGTGGLTKSGTTALTLNGTNSYTGATMVNAGSLVLGGVLGGSSITIATNASLSQSAGSVIAGSAVTLTCSGNSTLAGTNTYGGATTVGVSGTPNLSLTVNNNAALGTTAAGTTVFGGDGSFLNRLYLGKGVTVTNETLTLNGSGGRSGLSYNQNSGTGTWAGDISCISAAYIESATSGGTLTIGSDAKTVMTNAAACSVSMRGNGDIALNSWVAIGTGNTLLRNDAGTLLINSANNVWGDTGLSEGTIRMNATNGLPTTTVLSIGKSDKKSLCVLDLNGFDQTIRGLVDVHYAGSGDTTGTQRIISIAPATLTLSNDTARTFGKTNSVIEGAITLKKLGAATLTLTGTNSYSGATVVSNGTLTVSATGTLGTNSLSVVVGGSGTLALSTSGAISDAAVVQMPPFSTSTAKIQLDTGVVETVGWLLFGDTFKSVGTYGATGSGSDHIDDTHFTGGGRLRVLHSKMGLMISVR